MPDLNVGPYALPDHVEQSVQSIAQFHADHHESATLGDKVIDRITTALGRATSVVVLTVVVVAWISFNLLAGAFGFRPLDPPPFTGLTCAVSISAFYLVIVILASEQRANSLAERREQLTLELAILSERKTAKVIQLLEEFRRDDARMRDRADVEAEEMSQPTDPSAIIAKIDATNANPKTADAAPG